jgi:hypothetical protein
MRFDRTRARILLVLIAVLLNASTPFAQTRLPRETAKPTDLPVSGAAKASARNPCSAYGPGFVRVEGSDTCVKIGGGIGVGVSSGGRGR